MGIVNIDNLQPGMVLTADVSDRNGQILLGSGSALTEKNIRIFRMWGVTEANVEGVVQEQAAAAAMAQIDPAVLAEVEKEVGSLFTAANRDNPVIQELMRLALLRRAKAKSPGGAHAR